MNAGLDYRGRRFTPAEPAGRLRNDWRAVDEAGTVAGLRALVVMATFFGRPAARFVVRFVAVYYLLASRSLRRRLTRFRDRLGLESSLGSLYDHVLRFAESTLDALFFLQGKTELFDISRDGYDHLAELRDSQSSAILLGAHVGSFYAMRGQSRREGLPLIPIVYTKNARRLNALLESLDPSSTTRLVEIDEGGQMEFMLAIRDRVEQGALVAILGDRVQPGGRSVEVDFLGGRIRLPVGPYIIASVLRRPVYFTLGIYEGGNRYALSCVPFADRIVLPRRRREEALRDYAQAYATMLEAYARRYPENWFNFFDFFVEGESSRSSKGESE